MPANLTPQYKAAEARMREASTPDEKLSCLQEMLRLIPKHKGTEKLQADLKKRIAKLQGAETRKSGGRVPGEYVDRDGHKQVVLVGGPNAGKSALMDRLTAAEPEVAPYPYTTTRFHPGMMPIDDVQVQLVDAPAVSSEFVRAWMQSQVRACDLILWVVSLGDDDILTTTEDTLGVLEHWHTMLVPARELAPQDVDRAGAGPVLERPTLLVATHADDDGADLREEIFRESLSRPWEILRTSVETGEGLEALRQAIFESLRVVRVYTKQPGKKADMESPFLLDRGSTVLDLAEAVHRELAEGLSFARIWGAGAFDGQHVQRDHVLSDGDVVELHA